MSECCAMSSTAAGDESKYLCDADSAGEASRGALRVSSVGGARVCALLAKDLLGELFGLSLLTV